MYIKFNICALLKLYYLKKYILDQNVKKNTLKKKS